MRAASPVRSPKDEATVEFNYTHTTRRNPGNINFLVDDQWIDGKEGAWCFFNTHCGHGLQVDSDCFHGDQPIAYWPVASVLWIGKFSGVAPGPSEKRTTAPSHKPPRRPISRRAAPSNKSVG